MRSITIVCVSALSLLAVPASATATAASAEMFPSLRKRFEKKRAAAAAQKTAEVQVSSAPDAEEKDEKDDKDVKDAGPVMPVMDAGSEGYPVLPAVSTMLSDASGTLKAVNAQASSLEARVVQAQMISESKMAKQKAAFDEKLKQQENGNRQVIAQNSNITNEIKNLKDSNAALKKHSKEVEKSNKNMRAELTSLQAHLGTAKEFTAKSLTSTDDSKNSMLQILHGNSKFNHHHRALVETASSSKRKHSDDDDDEDSSDDSDDDSDDKDDDGSDDEDSATSFLALSSSRTASADGAASFDAAMSELDSAVPSVPAVDATSNAAPADLLDVLSKDVANLAAKTKAAQSNLKALFIRDFRTGAKRHVALMAKQKSLIANRTELLSVQNQLKKAEAHLEGTQKELEAKLHGLGQFIQKLAHFAMAPQHEVPHLLEVLPKVVAVKGEDKLV